MKIPKLLKRVQEYVDADKLKQCKRKDCMKEVLQKLKKQQHALKDKLGKEKNEKERKRIQKALDIIYLQRKKGLKALKKLQKS
ncbi:hypothetical protein DJ030_01255 [bacterium endosymbiont of Escarpia laminata]|nr:MAG: hypothetical protein DJ030_01255 [bacterium endosymbiont of Escarpia laminata]